MYFSKQIFSGQVQVLFCSYSNEKLQHLVNNMLCKAYKQYIHFNKNIVQK